MRRSWLVALLTLGAFNVVFLQGCPKPVETPDAGPIEPEVDAGVDAGPVDAGFVCFSDEECQSNVSASTICWGARPAEEVGGECIAKCVQDDDCAQFDQGLRCEERTGRCIAARGCNNDTNCPPPGFDPDDYCNVTGVGCRCVTETNETGFPGVCRRRLNVCSECTDDSQCGNGPTFDPNGRCLALQGDTSAALPDGGVRKYCFNTPAGTQCPCGMVLSGEGLCIPQNRSCEAVGCDIDKDCPSGTVCDSAACLCEPRCVWNFDPSVQALNPPGCSPDQTCWVDKASLDPLSVYWGAGRCEPPCESDEQCQTLMGGDQRYVCKGEKVAGGESGKRCRPAGCMDDWECPEPVPGALELGYCDRNTFSCKNDCRTGTDPVTGQPFDDCITGYKCAPGAGGVNRCVQQTCVELGGARVACNAGQYCCGEDKDSDGLADPCPTSGIETNLCYDAPRPPFCTTCQSNDDCIQYANPSGSQLPPFCIYGGDRPGGGQGSGVNVCAMATYNDFTTDAFGVPKAFKGCPAKYSAQQIKVDCTSNAECDPAGAPGTGRCGPDLTRTLPDGTHPNACLCTATGDGTSHANCPFDPNDPTKVQSWCRFAPAMAETQCIQSVLCVPSATITYGPTDQSGCGL